MKVKSFCEDCEKRNKSCGGCSVETPWTGCSMKVTGSRETAQMEELKATARKKREKNRETCWG